MAKKENKGGILKNEQVEQDLKAKGKAPEGTDSYSGSQDTGDKEIRNTSNDVQKKDGLPEGEQNGEN